MKKLLSLTVALVMIMAVLSTAGIMVSAVGIDSVEVSTAPTGLEALSIEGTEFLYEDFADDYDDPNWVTDEQLLGVWDPATETWTTESLLNYEKYYVELYDVQEAVKAGDYATAKDILTEYYRQKFLAQPRTITKTSATSSLISAKMLCYNMQGNGTYYDIATLTQEERVIKMDITAAAQSAANSTSGKDYPFQINATHDDGYMGYMYSRESDFVPYVEANVDGQPMTFPVIADTYIRGGQYKAINYGTSDTNPDNKLLIQEHVDYSQSGIGYPAYNFTWSDVILDDVCRPRFIVDFSALAKGSTVNSAKLCFVGATDNPDGKTIAVAYNAGFRGSETDSSWSWSGLSEDGRGAMSYWGLAGTAAFAGDNSTKYNRNIAANWGKGDTLAKVYRYTEDETYAYHAFRFLNAQVNEQGYDPLVASRGSGTWKNNLSCATRSSSIPETIAHLATSQYFTAENFIPLLKYAYSSGEALVRCWDATSQGSNWGTYETAGLSNLVVNFKEFRIVDEPMIEGGVYGVGNTGGWKELINHRYYIISGEVILEDDAFDESMGYGKETFNNFLKYPKYAEQAGETAEISEPLKQNMNKLASYIVTVAGPRFTSNQYGDSYAYGSIFASVALDAAKLTGDPFLWWVGTYGKEGTAPDFTSKIYPVNRHAALKSGWGINDLYMNFVADTGKMGHNHPDDLHVSLFAYGDPLLVDSMQYSYGTNAPERNAVYATAMHNTLSIKVTNPETGIRENLSHMANISGIYSGPYPVYSEFLPKDNWPNAWFNRTRNGEPGTVHTYELNSAYDHVEMSHSNYEDWYRTGYDYAKANANMKRSVLMIKKPKYVIVTDYVKALDDEEYTVAQNWHFLPAAGFNETDNPDIITEFETTGVARTNFAGKANLQIIPVKAQSQLEYVYEKEGYYCRTQGVIQNNPYPAYEKHGSGDKVFNTVLLPTAGGQNIKSSALNLQMDVPETTATASRITMTDEDTNQTREVFYYFLHDEMQKAQREFGKLSTDGKMALVEKFEGDTTMYILQDGTNITDTANQKLLVKSSDMIEELSVSFDSGNMNIDTTKEINLENLTIRAESTVSQVYLNGESIQFHQADNYIYFGDDAILSDPTEDDDDETATKVPSHGSSGGGGGGGSSEKEDKEEKPVEDPTPADPTPVTPSSDEFKDELDGHWGEAEITSLIEAGIVKGSDGKLNLKNTVTRAELLALIVRAMGLEEKEYNGEFADVQKDDWYANVVATAKAAGFVDGDGEMVMPNAPVTREQMAKFLVIPYMLKNPDAEPGEAIEFTDADEMSTWAAPYVNMATKLGILNGMGDGTFAPKNEVLREQAFAAIARLIK